jgi:hypothetical protein
MKILYLCVGILFTNGLIAQRSTNDKVYTAKYQYQMDDYFLKNRKLIFHLDTLLPLLFDELDSARSTDGYAQPDYYVSIVVGTHLTKDKEYIADGFMNYGGYTKEKYQFVTTYGFNSYLLLKDKSHTVLKIYYITEKKQDFQHRFSKEFDPAYQSVATLSTVRVINPTTNQPNYTPIRNYGPWEFINTNDKNFEPPIIEKNQIVVQRLFDLQPVK